MTEGSDRLRQLWVPALQPIPTPGHTAYGAFKPGVSPSSYSVFADGCGWLKAAIGRWPPSPRCTIVALGTTLTDAGLISLLTAIRFAIRQGGQVKLIHAGAGGTSLLHTLSREVRALQCQSIQIEPTSHSVATARQFATAPYTGPAEIIIDGHGTAHAPHWDAVPVPDGAVPLTAGDAVVVTGGLGGLGRAVALHLSRRLAVHPILVDCVAPTAPAARLALARLGAEGQPFTLVTADVTEAGTLQQALKRHALARRVRAVIHCAGLIEGRRIRSLTEKDLKRLILPKVAGLRHTLEAVDSRRLNTVIAFGSILARQPHPGVGAYALANELLRRDAERCARIYQGSRFLTAEWSIWDGAGAAAESGAVAVARSAGYSPISLAHGLRMVESLLTWRETPASVVVSALPPAVPAPVR